MDRGLDVVAVRHPMYAAIWLWAVAQGMLLANWLAGWSIVPVFAAMSTASTCVRPAVCFHA
jgi:protein-S-isoprenylcysteine O-methyltransferase Ste14